MRSHHSVPGWWCLRGVDTHADCSKNRLYSGCDDSKAALVSQHFG
jgi:hypothetical protein